MTVYITGDIHGSGKDVVFVIDQIANPSENDYIIICGDASLEYGDYIMDAAKKAMKKFPGTWIIMRGNHDNRYWRDHSTDDGWHIDGDYLIQDKYPNIWYVRDEGGIYEIDGSKILFIPGAFSVDGEIRLLRGLPYEHEEQLTYSEFYELLNLASTTSDIDYVVSHTAPISLEHLYNDLFIGFLPQHKIDKTTEHGLDAILDTVENTFKHWYFGHFHDDRDLNDKFTMLYNRIVPLGEQIGD